MATLNKLVEVRTLVRVTVPLGRGLFHDRWLYAYPECLEWMRNDVPKMVTGRLQAEQTPLEQLHVRVRQWISGQPMHYGPMFSNMTPLSDYVCEIKTPDLRIFGWIYQPKKFIAVFGDYADDYKPPTKRKTYADARRKVVAARDALPLDGDKFANGDFDDLV
jgi:hypothetical protein